MLPVAVVLLTAFRSLREAELRALGTRGLFWRNVVMAETSMLIGGQWRPALGEGRTEEVRSPFDGSVVGEIPVSGPADVEAALVTAVQGATLWRRTPAHERMRILLEAARLADERAAETARII